MSFTTSSQRNRDTINLDEESLISTGVVGWGSDDSFSPFFSAGSRIPFQWLRKLKKRVHPGGHHFHGL